MVCPPVWRLVGVIVLENGIGENSRQRRLDMGVTNALNSRHILSRVAIAVFGDARA